MMMAQVTAAQSGSSPVSLDIMTTAVYTENFDSIPFKVSIPGEVNASELMFQLSDDTTGEIFITGIPYDSLGVNVPANITFTNQYGESAELQRLRLLHGSSDDRPSMDVLPPIGCTTVEIPATGRIHLKIGGEITSDNRLRGIYTGSLKLSCDKAPRK